MLLGERLTLRHSFVNLIHKIIQMFFARKRFQMTSLQYCFFILLCMSNAVHVNAFLLKTEQGEKSLIPIEKTEAPQDPFKNATIHNIKLETSTGIKVPVLHIDRQSDIVLILGQGLPAQKEEMLKYAALFETYDIILFDYRWCKQYGWLLAKSIALFSPIQRILLDEEQEVRAVLSYIQDKNFQKVVGLGVCYSNFLFAKIQSDDAKKDRGPFTHLILDSCWYSLKSFAKSIATDPYLPTSPQYGGAPSWLKALTNSRVGLYIATNIVFRCINDISIEKALNTLDCPVLFIHGQEDIMVPMEKFGKLWNAAQPHKRSALLTPNPHAASINNHSIYAFIAEQFIGSTSLKKFIQNTTE